VAELYKYVAVDKDGKTVKGRANAESIADLTERLLLDNKYLMKGHVVSNVKSGGRIKQDHLADFLKQLGTLLKAGVSLVRALKMVADNEVNTKKETRIYNDLLRLVKQGNSFSDSLDRVGCFPDLLLNMVKSAEMSGNLDDTLLAMADHYSKQYKLAQKIKGSLTYSKILGVIIVIVVIILIAFVLPMFDDLFSGLEKLPLPTQILFGISDFFSNYWVLLILFGVFVVFAGSVLIKMYPVKWQLDKIKVRIPVFGKLNKKILTARFASTLSTLYSAGIPMITAIQVAKDTIGNVYIQSQFDNVISSVRAGGTLSDALSKVDGFVKKLQSSVYIGEETGYLDSMLKSVADMLDYEAEAATQKLVAYIEPAMIALMAIIVGFIMISVLAPIYDSYGAIGGGVL